MQTKPSTKTNSEFFLVLKAHLAEYLNKPLLNLGFILSLAIATSTLLCILVLNHASEQQYQAANRGLKSPVSFYIVANSGDNISRHDFSHLKAQGFYQLAPIHLFGKTLASGKKISFRAIDILPLVLAMPKSFTTHHINLSSKYAKALGLTLNSTTDINDAKQITLADGQSLKVNYNQINDWGKVALVDLPLAWQLFPDIKGFSHLMVTAISADEKARLAAALPEYLSIQEDWSLEEREGFADALHLNLSALAILGFIVSLFIAFQAADQAWQKRGELAAKLRLLGVELTSILKVMLCEALLLTLLASIIGIAIAFALVSILLPILGITLEQLYQLRQSGHFQWHWLYSLWAFAISAVAVFLALLKQFRLISSAKIALTARIVPQPFNYRASAAIGVTLLAVFLLWPEVYGQNSWHLLMIKYGLLLIASVALLPNILSYLLKGMSYFTRSFRVKFVVKDARQQVGRRYLPLAAFYLALTASISAALMVNSFEKAFTAYLEQLLSADLFISYNPKQKNKVEAWLKQQDDIDEYVLFKQTVAKYGNDTLAVHALMSAKQQNSLLFKARSSKQQATGQFSCYINEQLSLKKGLALNEQFTVEQGLQQLTCTITAIFYDYGNQGYSVKIPLKAQEIPLSGWREHGFGVYFKGRNNLSTAALAEQLGLDNEQIFLPEEIKTMALAIFKQTFVLTQAIAFVLLIIACFGLFLSANNLELARKPDLHILSSLGYSRIELFSHMLMQWLLLAFGVLLLSWPIAGLLAKALVAKVLPASFGWSMPLVLDIAPFALTSITGLLILLPALAIPLYKLNVRASLS
ncbi:ABC transporter [Colwellia sp. MT41]|uniref:FtsX-like permease family protein n=1 Tax=Colwellia sp. MT41 TaxID=58049 RepID=UPI0007175CB4|nr:FtsX-like permease family protein [Colwellia sp. MT41]ALO33511.1 ABC transporter [Colwellia sp. MT41]